MNWIQSSRCNSQACVQLAWVKSSHSLDNGTCVQVAQDTEIGLLRDSKDPDGPVLQFPRQAVREFLAAIKCGQFDR